MQQVIKRIRLLAIYAALLLPVIVYGAVQALQSSNNSPIDWVDSSFSERKHYDEFVELFGPGDAVVASWPECYWTDERLDTLVTGLRESKTFRSSDGSPLFQQVSSGRETLLSMTQQLPATYANPQVMADPAAFDESAMLADAGSMPRSQMSVEVALKRLQGTMIGKDGQTTCVVMILNNKGLAVRASVVENIRKAIRVCCNVAEEDIHLAGPVIDGLTVDAASHASLTTFAAPSAIVIFVICWWSLGSLISGAVVFLAASFCQAALLAIIYFSGETLSALLIILPPLVQVLTVSGGIHLMNYYDNALEFLPPREAAVDAFRKGWLPSVLSLGTTAMGTASLMVSGLEPIRLFGIYGTVGVLLATAIVLTVIPCSMILIGRRASKFKGSTETGKQLSRAEQEESSSHGSGVALWWHRLASLLYHRNTLALTILFGIMIAGAAGLPGLETSIRIETLFTPESRIMQDYRWLEENVGPLVPIEVLLTFGEESNSSDGRRMNLLWHVNEVLLKYPHVKSTTSALTIFPDMPSAKSLTVSQRMMKAAIVKKGIEAAKPAFERMAMLRHSKDGEVWRITAHVSALAPLDYGVILKDIRAITEKELDEAKADGVTISTSGIMPLVHQIQGQLLSDLFNSLMSALLVITLTMTIVEAGVLTGILAMASNVFPIIIAFGMMGWLAHPMDIGSVMTASVALGIAVDDTLHFLAFFRRMLGQPGATRFSAVLSAYHHCGVAMIQTSVSCGIGLLVFAFSDFVPTSRFAVLMAFLLLLALLGDLLLLPALLLSPAGRLFEPAPDLPENRMSDGHSNEA